MAGGNGGADIIRSTLASGGSGVGDAGDNGGTALGIYGGGGGGGAAGYGAQDGGAGGSGGYGILGSAGGGGAGGTAGSLDGHAGGNGDQYAGGGGGGGGYAAYYGYNLDNFGTLTGGNGGAGGAAGAAGGAGGGGEGGAGAVIDFVPPPPIGAPNMIFLAGDYNSGTISGGNGGAGGSGEQSHGDGGDGGAGILFLASSTFVNTGFVTGGNGGVGGSRPVDIMFPDPGMKESGAAGAGGAGVVGANLDISNHGVISGGLSGDGARAYAIDFTGGTNVLRIADGSSTTGEVHGGGDDTLDYAGYSSGVTVNLDYGTATATDGVLSIEHVIGSDHDDTLTGSYDADDFAGGFGNDRIDGGEGVDTMAGGAGSDVYVVTSGDTVTESAGEGWDTVMANFDYTLLDNFERLTLTGSGAVNGTGNDGNNRLNGNAGGNVLNGLGGNDVLVGNGGGDTLDGGAGDDTLIGGFGTDALTGGEGLDTFVFGKLGHSAVGTAKADKIADFSHADGDHIDLSAIDAILGGSDDAFDFVGRDAFSYTAGELRYRYDNAGHTIVACDVDGDGTADMSIVLTGTLELTADDFVL